MRLNLELKKIFFPEAFENPLFKNLCKYTFVIFLPSFRISLNKMTYKKEQPEFDKQFFFYQHFNESAKLLLYINRKMFHLITLTCSLYVCDCFRSL